jgi:hypothetical protein
MQFNLTFNKPAAQLLEGVSAVKVRAEGKGKVMFKASKRETGRDVFPISSRTRGGLGITVSGKFADEFLQTTKTERGVHMTLEQGTHGWIHGAAHGAAGEKPSKIVPTARLWRAVEERATKAEDAPARAPRKARATAAEAGDEKPARKTRGAAGRAKANAGKTKAAKTTSSKSGAKRAPRKTASANGDQATTS